jgi:hypothetical protein
MCDSVERFALSRSPTNIVVCDAARDFALLPAEA